MNASEQRSHVVGVTSLVALVAAVFWPVLGFDFVRWDDDINITQNPLLTDPWSWSLAGRLFDAGQALRFKPVHWLFDRFVYAVVGFSPGGWHAVNLALHAGTAVLFFVVLRRVLARALAPAAESILAAWVAAAVWAVHPLRAEPVAWATASPYLLTALWLLGSFGCYLEAHSGGALRGRWLVAAWLLALAAYGTYPVAATYGLWLLATDAWLLRVVPGPGHPRSERLQWIAKHAAFLLPAVAATAVTIWTRLAEPGIFTEAPGLASVGLPTRTLMALASLGYLVTRVVWPVELTPNMPPIALDSATFGRIALLAAGTAIALTWLWFGRKRHPLRAWVGFGFAGLSVPCLGLTERPTWPVDRYSHVVDLIWIGAAAGWTMWRVRDAKTWRFVGVATAAVVIAVCAVAARRQAATWRDSRTLFAAMERHPKFHDNPRQAGHVYVLWGSYEATEQQPETATQLFTRAQQIYLDAIKAALAGANFSEALSILSHIEHHFGLTPELRREKGAWLLHSERPQEAIRELRAAADAMPDDLRTKTLLAEANGRSGTVR